MRYIDTRLRREWKSEEESGTLHDAVVGVSDDHVFFFPIAENQRLVWTYEGNPPTVEDIPQAEIDAKLSAIAFDIFKQQRRDLVEAIKVTVDGMIFDGDEESQSRMSRAVSSATDMSETTLWKLADNTIVTVTAGQLKEAMRLAGQAQTAIWFGG